MILAAHCRHAVVALDAVTRIRPGAEAGQEEVGRRKFVGRQGEGPRAPGGIPCHTSSLPSLAPGGM